MSVNILMPALSPTMTEGTLSRWLKKEGESIAAGDVLAEIETDKATMEVEAVDEGVLGRILIADGTEGVKVNEPIGIIVGDGEAVPSGPQTAASPEPAAASSADASSSAVPPSAAAPSAAATGPKTGQPAGQGSGHEAGHEARQQRVFISPLARRLAGEAGIDPHELSGSGPNGRIVRADVEAARGRPAKPAAEAPKPAPAPAAAVPAKAPANLPVTAPHQKIPNSGIRRVIARRLLESKQFVPHFYVSIDVELDRLLALRSELNAASPKEGPGAFKLSVNDLLIKAAAVTLRRVPKVNASYTDEAILQYDDVDISVAVSIPDGLITPIVRRADAKSLSQLSNEAKALIARAREGKLKPEEFQGGSFSISNMGMYGVREFAAIINPPQGAILAVSAGDRRTVVREGDRIEIASVMTCTLSADHRVIDGALAAQWMAAFKTVVESPMSLVV